MARKLKKAPNATALGALHMPIQNYPQINLRTEILQSKVIETFGYSNNPDYTERKNGAS